MTQISATDVPRIIKERLPWFSELAAEYLEDLNGCASYPLLGDIIHRLVRQANSGDPEDAMRVAQFFQLLEEIYENCDAEASDLFALEILEPMLDLPASALKEYMGPKASKEFQSVIASHS